MKAGSHCMPEACLEASSAVQRVQIEVSLSHPLLLLKRSLPWEAITKVMTRHWREHGKNVDGGAGLPWDVSLYVPLVVLMLIKHVDSRQMEVYLAENVGGAFLLGVIKMPKPKFAITPTLLGPMRPWAKPASRR
jgi:hypothetical protein